ncbi:MAG: thioredoxin domain-containing protein, partial [Candidatus Magasanikbacteria bacterium]|nr:thioredoxin domain-containing protein [Candidatus Magasanikbacteria bacterium]
MAFNNSPVGLRWYQRFGGVLGIALSATAVAIVLFFAGSVWYYDHQIKPGTGELLLQTFYGGFSASDKKAAANSTDVNRSEVELPGAPSAGTNNPKVTVVEFVDFKCPNCKAEAPILRQVMQKYGSKVKLIIRNFPVESTHPGANQLSVLAQCAYYQGWYWQLHDWLYDNQESLGDSFTTADIDDL